MMVNTSGWWKPTWQKAAQDFEIWNHQNNLNKKYYYLRETISCLCKDETIINILGNSNYFQWLGKGHWEFCNFLLLMKL